MQALDLLREQAAGAERMFEQVMASLTAEQAVWRAPGSTANPIATTILHTYHGEDGLVHQLLGAPSVFERGGWQQRLGYDPSQAWTLPENADPSALRAYAAAVAAATQDFLKDLDAAALDREVETARGRRVVGNRLAVYLIGHKFEHSGEIGALLGCQGVTGGGL